ncbi:MAG: hypothetical protein WD401_03725 [Thermomicrobiaceae bacterium]
MRYLLKDERGTPASELDQADGEKIIRRGRHQGRRVVAVYVLHAEGVIDRYEERARRKLGSNAIAARTWLCETLKPGESATWGDERYIPNPEEAIQETEPKPEAILQVLLGAEHDDEANVEQLAALRSPS